MPLLPPVHVVARGGPPTAQRFARPVPGAFGWVTEIVIFPEDAPASVVATTGAASATGGGACFIGAGLSSAHAKNPRTTTSRMLVCARLGVAIDSTRTVSAARADR